MFRSSYELPGPFLDNICLNDSVGSHFFNSNDYGNLCDLPTELVKEQLRHVSEKLLPTQCLNKKQEKYLINIVS